MIWSHVYWLLVHTSGWTCKHGHFTVAIRWESDHWGSLCSMTNSSSVSVDIDVNIIWHFYDWHMSPIHQGNFLIKGLWPNMGKYVEALNINVNKWTRELCTRTGHLKSFFGFLESHVDLTCFILCFGFKGWTWCDGCINSNVFCLFCHKHATRSGKLPNHAQNQFVSKCGQ